MAILAPARYVVAPAVTPQRFGIFSVSTLIDVTDPHELVGVNWEPTYCGPAQITGVECPSDSAFGVPKEYTAGGTLVEATPFAVFGSWACSPIGHWDDAQDRATAALFQGEERAVERAVHLAEAGNVMSFQGATDVTPVPGTAVSITDAFAILEAYAALNFNGVGVIHANPREVTRAANAHLLDELPASAPTLMTNLGTLVASEGGMSGNIGPTGAAPAAGTHWIFMTGRPVIRRSSVVLTPPNRNAGLNTATNDLEMLAERIYVIAWDCGTVAILVNEADTDEGALTNAQLRADPVPISGTVEIVNDVGNPIPVTLPTAQRTTSIARVTAATTTNIAAGNRSYTVTVIAAASAASPTLDGVALPAGYTASYSADGANTLEAAAVVTVAGDDVIILSVT